MVCGVKYNNMYIYSSHVEVSVQECQPMKEGLHPRLWLQIQL